MVKIAPSILAADINNIEQEIGLINQSNCEYIHCDIMDGHFVSNTSFGSSLVKNVRKLTNKILDVHLMVKSVESDVELFSHAGADLISFHIEAEINPIDRIKQIKKNNIKVGVAIKPSTSIDSVTDFIDDIDLILIMTVEPGLGGQKFLDSQLSKIYEIRNLISKKSLNTDIEVDGGINKQTGKMCVDAGANILVAGTYIFDKSINNYKERINSLRY